MARPSVPELVQTIVAGLTPEQMIVLAALADSCVDPPADPS